MPIQIKNVVCIFTISLLITTHSGFAQKGLNLQFSLQTLNSYIGEYRVPLDFTNPERSVPLQTKLTFGIEADAAIGYNFNNYLGLNLGFCYSHQGQNYNDYTGAIFVPSVGNFMYSWKRTLTLNYLKIPIAFVFQLNPNSVKKMSFYGTAGLYAGFLMSYKDENNIAINEGSNYANIITKASGNTYSVLLNENGNMGLESADFISKPYTSDFGVSLGAGMKIKLTPKLSLPIILNYQKGLKNLKNLSSSYKYPDNSATALFWDANSGNPNATIKYKSELFGLKVGLILAL